MGVLGQCGDRPVWRAAMGLLLCLGALPPPSPIWGGVIGNAGPAGHENDGGWAAALTARAQFEAQPAGSHDRAAYSGVMDRFRAIYHADPADPHAARAVAQVAELLAEEGRELGDRKSLHDAAGQYEFLARAYPGSSLARESLERAASLLGPEAANDLVELGKVRAAIGVRGGPGAGLTAPAEVAARPARVAATPIAPAESHQGEVPAASEVRGTSGLGAETSGPDEGGAGTPALVSAIRHWSTASYTRVAIDLGGDVRFQAARVQNPDRIFFDLHHARLAPQLVGKSFAVTDEGFLTRIRAAQYSDEVTRVVLDVHEVAEYSAFLLPNPYRLIIDIHGKAEEPGRRPTETAVAPAGSMPAVAGISATGSVSAAESPTVAAASAASSEAVPAPAKVAQREHADLEPKVPEPKLPEPKVPEHYVPRRARLAAEATGGAPRAVDAGPPGESGAGSATRSSTAEGRSSLPPMPVTDGGAAFGLPAKKAAGSAGSAAVAAPRVVIPSRPSTLKPVPNTVTTRSATTGTEVAAVSEQPGKIEATSRPTSQPVFDRGGVSRAAGPDRGSGERAGALAAVPTDTAVPRTARSRRGGKAVAADVAGDDAGGVARDVAVPPLPAPPTAEGETSLLRALGLKIGRIVIDAGHGGHDSGTLGVDGLEEKDVVLDVALRLGRLLHDRLGAEIVYTRADDTFIPLETRTAIANKAQADLFVSVHANSSADPSARGVEVYYLNFTSDPEAMQVASRENAVSTKSVHELSDLVRKIALKDKIEESRELAVDVDASLFTGLARGNDGLRDRGVKKAPFVVLIGANMPSILAEISFVTNPRDAGELNRPEYRQRVAESLYTGVARYAGSINGRRTATHVERAEKD